MRNRKILLILMLVIAFLSVGISSQALTDIESLGKQIFFDETLSIRQNQSCASCHDPEWGWTGPTSEVNAAGAVYEGSINNRFGNRKPPSAAYATTSPVLALIKGIFIGGNFWDGRATGEKLGNPAADQAQGPFLNPLEMALKDPADVISRICDSGYAGQFTEVFNIDPCDPENVDTAYDYVALAVAAYEASPEVNAFTSKFDAGMSEFTDQERKGFVLFTGKAKCAKCHPGNGKKPLFTDYSYDNLGIPKNPENPFYTMPARYNPLREDWIDLGLGGFLITRLDYQQYADANYGLHKVPTLRNVDMRGTPDGIKAYGHNGYFKSLKEIVHFYNTRDVESWPAPEIDVNINVTELGDLGLTEEEEDAVVAFLKTLSDGYIPKD